MGHKPNKPMRLRKDGKPDKRYVEDPLTRVCRRRLEALRNERLSFVVVGDPLKCDKGCWQLKQCQQSDQRAFKALGDTQQVAQFPMACLRSADEITENYRGFVMRCPCLSYTAEEDTKDDQVA